MDSVRYIAGTRITMIAGLGSFLKKLLLKKNSIYCCSSSETIRYCEYSSLKAAPLHASYVKSVSR